MNHPPRTYNEFVMY